VGLGVADNGNEMLRPRVELQTDFYGFPNIQGFIDTGDVLVSADTPWLKIVDAAENDGDIGEEPAALLQSKIEGRIIGTNYQFERNFPIFMADNGSEYPHPIGLPMPSGIQIFIVNHHLFFIENRSDALNDPIGPLITLMVRAEDQNRLGLSG
jgi:hypothetical protein